MTDPALDGPDAERAVAAALKAVYASFVDAAPLVAALNDADVVLCDELAVAALRRLAVDLRAIARGTSPARRLTGDEAARILLSRHGLA